jgi:hypothetical protein
MTSQMCPESRERVVTTERTDKHSSVHVCSVTSGVSGGAASASVLAHSISNPHVSFMPSSAAAQAVLPAGGMGYAGGAWIRVRQAQQQLHIPRFTLHARTMQRQPK